MLFPPKTISPQCSQSLHIANHNPTTPHTTHHTKHPHQQIAVLCCAHRPHGRRGSKVTPHQHTWRWTCVHCVAHPLCTRCDAAFGQWQMQLNELLLERGAVALCPHSTGCAQPLARVLEPDEGVRTNEAHLQFEAHCRTVEPHARPLQIT